MVDDDLFAEREDDWWYRAILNDRSWLQYAFGYREAANVVVASLADQGRSYGVPAYPDSVAFPVAFCYRHYIELMLKALIIDASRLLGRAEQPPWTHRLDKLWSPLRPKLEEIWPDDDLDPMEANISQFRKLDPTGEEFRFPFVEDKQAKKSGRQPKKFSLQSVPGLNLLGLKEIVDDLAPMLNGAIDGIDALRQVQP